MAGPDVEGLLRDLVLRALSAVVRRHGEFADAENAVQEALLAAAVQWPRDLPTNRSAGWSRWRPDGGLLERMTGNPVVTLNRAVALAVP